MGVALFRLGDAEGAAAELSRVTRIDPAFPHGWQYLGDVERALGDVDSALRRYKTGMESSPEDMDLRVAYVRALRETGRLDEAIAAARDALKINARSLPLYHEMGLCWLAKGDAAMARFVYEKAGQLPGSDTNPSIQAGFGWSLHLIGEKYGALARLQKSVELDPNLVFGLVHLSRLYLDDHNYEGMIPLLENARRLDPTNHGVWVDLGVAYRGAGRLDDAQAAWKQALTLDPKRPQPHFNLGVLYGDDLKQYEQAIGELQLFIDTVGASDPDAVQAPTYLEQFKKLKTRAEQRRLRKEREEQERQEAERQAREEEERLRREEQERQQAPPPEGTAPSGEPGAPDGTEPTPTDPSAPAPADPTPTDPGPADPTPSEPAPTDPAPTDPAPTESGSSPWGPTEPAPQDPPQEAP